MSLELSDISIWAGTRPLITDFSLSVEPGEVVTLMGPSGCGKSTLLAYLSGALPDEITGTGLVKINNVAIEHLPMEQRGVGLQFQDDLLFPHMNVASNLAFALPPGLPRSERQARIGQALAAAAMDGYENYDPAHLSGGQRARISLMRTLLAAPKVLLLDEPFSKLDRQLRGQIRDFVFQRIREQNIPALLVTHDRQDCSQRTIALNTQLVKEGR